MARRYVREVFTTKAVATRRDNEKELVNLLKVFGHMPIDAIAPMHIRGYMDVRGQVAKVRANREKALFSHMGYIVWRHQTRSPCVCPLHRRIHV